MQNTKIIYKFPFRILIIFPALILGFLLWKYGVNCPFMDEWDTPGMDLVQFNLGELNFDRLIRQHNESRKLFPRLLFIYLSRNNWNPRSGMLISLLLSCLTTFNIYYLSKLTIKENTARRLAYLTLSSMLIFSPMQWENWLWGLQMITFIPIAAITSSLVIIYTQNPMVVKLLASAVLATCATFSFANGIISWVVIFPALYLVAGKNGRLAWVTTGWLLLFSLNVAVYFHDYHRPAQHPSLIDALGKPIQSIAYYLSFLGSPLGIHQLWLNQAIGLGICLLIAFSYWYLLQINRDRSQDKLWNEHLIERLFPWLTILGYTFISGALTTAGRVGFGVDQSLASRYVTFSTYGLVSLIYIVAMILEEGDRSDDFSDKTIKNHRKTAKYSASIALALILLLYPINFTRGVRAMKVTYQNRLYGKSCLTLINVVPDRDCIENYIYPNFDSVLQRVNELDRIGLIQPSLVLSDRLENISRDSFSQINYGSFESLTLDEDNSYNASGWSILPQYNAPAHAVVLAFQTADLVHHAFAIAKPESNRKDLRQIRDNRHIGWEKSFPQRLIPDEAISLSAWSFDSNLARAYQLGELKHTIE